MSSRFIPCLAVRRVCAAIALSAIASTGAAVAAEVSVQPVKDPHYGDTLFHFFQDRYFTSITTLMVSQHFERVSHHADEAEVLRGGLLLSYGLHREAGEIFARLIETTTSPAVRDRAWFYLAKIRYQRSFLAEAEEAIDRVQKNLPADLEEERGLLKANLLMARGDYAGAATVLNGLSGSASAGLYARYNLGVALLRSGDTERGTVLLDELGLATEVPEKAKGKDAPAPLSLDEFQNLRDKANVALGFTALQAKVPAKARGYLERVRLSGAQSNKALLGFGWAAADLNDKKLALVPWTELATRETSDPSVLEARIAVPYAFAELGAYGQALDRYNEAIAAFETENKGLDESIAAIRSGKLVDALQASNPGEDMGWFWTLDQLPELPHAGHLAPVLAQHEFQEAFKNYRDLQFLTRNLNEWTDKLGVFDDMLGNRRKAYAERLPKVLAKANESGAAALQQRSDALDRDLAKAEDEADGLALADAKQREQLTRLAEVEATLKNAGSDPDSVAARERARFINGAITWQLAQAYPARLWDAKKALAGIAEGLAEARGHEAALVQAQRDEPARFDRFAERISALAPRIQALVPRIAALKGEQQTALQEYAVAELVRQKERLAEYTTQARFAVAQLYDRASLSSTRDNANKP